MVCTLKGVMGLETIPNRADSAHLHIRIIYHKRYRSAESTKRFKTLFAEGRLSGRSIKTTQPSKNMVNQTEEVFYSYALKNCFNDDNKYWLFTSSEGSVRPVTPPRKEKKKETSEIKGIRNQTNFFFFF